MKLECGLSGFTGVSNVTSSLFRIFSVILTELPLDVLLEPIFLLGDQIVNVLELGAVPSLTMSQTKCLLLLSNLPFL